MDLYFYTPEQRRMDNGKIVTNVLQLTGGGGTAEHLLKRISSCIGQPKELVKTDLKQVLRRGIQNGFLIKRGRTYFITAPDNSYQVDNDRKRSRARSRSPMRKPSTQFEVGQRRKATPYKKRLTGAASSSARLAAINQQLKDEAEAENEAARTSYRRPATPKRKKIRFGLPTEGVGSSSPKSPRKGSPKRSPLNLRRLNFDDDDDTESVS